MLRTIAIVTALALCSLSGSSSAYAQGKPFKTQIKLGKKAIYYSGVGSGVGVGSRVGAYACAHHGDWYWDWYLEYMHATKECRDQARRGDGWR